MSLRNLLLSSSLDERKARQNGYLEFSYTIENSPAGQKQRAEEELPPLLMLMAEHTGQSSQLFPVTTGRNAQFLATVARYLTLEK